MTLMTLMSPWENYFCTTWNCGAVKSEKTVKVDKKCYPWLTLLSLLSLDNDGSDHITREVLFPILSLSAKNKQKLLQTRKLMKRKNKINNEVTILGEYGGGNGNTFVEYRDPTSGMPKLLTADHFNARYTASINGISGKTIKGGKDEQK